MCKYAGYQCLRFLLRVVPYHYEFSTISGALATISKDFFLDLWTQVEHY